MKELWMTKDKLKNNKKGLISRWNSVIEEENIYLNNEMQK